MRQCIAANIHGSLDEWAQQVEAMREHGHEFGINATGISKPADQAEQNQSDDARSEIDAFQRGRSLPTPTPGKVDSETYICDYHRRFGENSRNCRSGCQFPKRSKSGNTPGGW